MHSAKAFFLGNSKSKVNLQDKSIIIVYHKFRSADKPIDNEIRQGQKFTPFNART